MVIDSVLNEIYPKALKQNSGARKDLKEYKTIVKHVQKLRVLKKKKKKHHSDCFITAERNVSKSKVKATKMSGIYPQLKADNHKIVLLCVHKLDHHGLDT